MILPCFGLISTGKKCKESVGTVSEDNNFYILLWHTSSTGFTNPAKTTWQIIAEDEK